MAAPAVLITGATGKIGLHLAKDLLSRQVPVTLYVRDLAKAKASLQAELQNATTSSLVHFAVGDLKDQKAFESAVQGHNRLFLLTNEASLEVGLVKTAVSAGIKQVVKISCVGANVGAEPGTVFQQHGFVEYQLVQEGLPVVFLRPHDFMENILNQRASIKSQGLFYNSAGNAQVASIAASDIASVAATILTDPIEKHNHLGYFLTGPEAVSSSELAGILSEVVSKPVNVVPIDDVAWYKTISGWGLPHKTAYFLASIPTYYRGALVGNRYTTGWVEVITGKKPKSWKQFFEENKDGFQ